MVGYPAGNVWIFFNECPEFVCRLHSRCFKPIGEFAEVRGHAGNIGFGGTGFRVAGVVGVISHEE